MNLKNIRGFTSINVKKLFLKLYQTIYIYIIIDTVFRPIKTHQYGSIHQI